MIVSFFFDSAMVSATALGAEVQVATALNLADPMEKMAPTFEQATGHHPLSNSQKRA